MCYNKDNKDISMQLRPHQLEGLNAMQTHSKGQIIVPTGGGKTMCMIEDVRRLFAPVSYTHLTLPTSDLV